MITFRKCDLSKMATSRKCFVKMQDDRQFEHCSKMVAGNFIKIDQDGYVQDHAAASSSTVPIASELKVRISNEIDHPTVEQGSESFVVINQSSTQTISDRMESTQTSAAGFQWPEKAVQELIRIYLDLQWMFQSTTCNHKQTWSMIADRLRDKGWPQITGTQASSKWRGLKMQFQKIKATGGSGACSRGRWPFYRTMEAALASDCQGSGAEGRKRGEKANLRLLGRISPYQHMPPWLRQLCADLDADRNHRRTDSLKLAAVLDRISDKL